MSILPENDPLPSCPAIERTPNGLRLHAPAKINLNLLVAPRRADGFHDLDSLVAKITLHDELELVPRKDERITFSCRGADCGSDEQNLALRAAVLLAEQAGMRQGVDLRLVKHIPPGKGLGGGSSDAAAVLRGLNELWFKSGVPMDMLTRLGAELGSDVPLFLGPPAARMTGRGEILQPARIHPFVAVLVLPAESTSTADVYRAFDELAATEQGAEGDIAARQLDSLALESRPPSLWRGLLRNDLFTPACRICGALGELHRRLSSATELPVFLTGSGSAMFILCDDLAEARRTKAQLPPGLAELILVRNH